MRLPEELVAGLGSIRIVPVHGGDTARAYRLDTSNGPVFLKTHPHPQPLMFEREARGLRALRQAAPASLHIPEVLAVSQRGILMEWIDEGHRCPGSDARLGEGLAELHTRPAQGFGGLDSDNIGFLGSVEVNMAPASSWPEFFLERRLRPLINRAVAEAGLPAEALRLLDVLEPRLGELCGPPEPPSLVHGDLWAGNRLVDASGENWLVDPVAHHAHRESDLAMMQLFGGFGEATFAAYQQVHPLADGWQQRVPWYQLAPLLVHVIIFGGGYVDAVMSRLRALG